MVRVCMTGSFRDLGVRVTRVGSTVPAALIEPTASSSSTKERAMAEGTVDVTVDAPPDAVWAKVGDFGGVADFLPGIDSLRLEGDDRIIGMFGMEIRERLLSRDDATRTITYSVIEGVPVESHTATMTVESEGDGSKVTWAYDVTPDEMAPLFGDTYKAGLAAIQSAFT
jgi:carbon monoxide dehydrogenase subunit G